MKLWRRACSMLLALTLVFGLFPAVRPIVAEAAVADTPAGVRNHLPSKATEVEYLSEMAWVHSVNHGGGVAAKDVTWSSGEAIILGDIAANGGTTFEKGLGVQPDATMNSSHESAMQTVFDLQNYSQSFFYAAAGITNDDAKSSSTAEPITNGVYFAVYASYDETVDSYADAKYELLETSPKITNGIVHQFHLDISGVRYLKLVVYAAQEDVSNMDCAWAGACVYNNTGYYPKSDLMGLNNGKTNATWVPTGTTRFHTYNFNNIPADATYLSGTAYKNADGTLVDGMTTSSATNLGTGNNRWLGGATDQITGLTGANTTDGICCTNASKYLRFNATKAVNGVAEGWVTFNITDLDVNRFYAVIGSGNDTAKHSAYNPANGTFGGVVCQVWGAETEDGDYTLLSESEPIMLSQTGEFLVDITDVNYLKLRVQLKDHRTISFMDTLIFSPCVFNEWGVTASGQSSVLRGLNANYTAVVRRDLTTNYDYTGDVTWDLEGTDNQGTTMENGKLTVAANESADELKITATINEGGKTITSAPITVNVVKSADGVRNHLPSIAKDVAYLSDMTWEACVNHKDVATTKNYAWNDSTAPIVLGDIAANGGTTFTKGLGVMPKGTDANDASYTVFDLQNYSQSFFYSAAGITNDTAKNSKSAENVTNGVIFAVYASYDTNEDANYVLLEKSDTLTKGLVHQFHLDVSGVHYLKLVVYAVGGINYMNAAWAGACVYNNPGYQPKTTMLGSCNGDEGKYVAPENPTMFNIYQFPNLPADAVTLAQQKCTETEVYTEEGDSSFGTHAGWVGGTHLPVKDKDGVTQEKTWQKDGIKFPAGSTLHFNARDNDISDGYVVYDVSKLGMDTFYCIVGAVNQTYKWSDYDPATGDFGGMVFEVWGNYEEGGEYTQLSESEPILKSNTGEFLLDITGVHSLKLRIRARDSRSHGYLTGGFVYASVFNEWSIEATGASSVTKGTSADYTAIVRQDLTIDSDYEGTVTWEITEDAGSTGATITPAGLLTVPPTATAGSTLTITASITPEEDEIFTSAPITVTVTSVPAGVRNHLPTTAKEIRYLSDMDWEYSENYHVSNFNDRGWHFVKDEEWWSGGAIILGATSEANGGTKFTKGLGVMPNKTTGDFTSNTVFDLADNDYAQSFFYSAVGITNSNGILYAAGDKLSNGSTFTGAGVIFEVWASYDKTEDDYASANYELLERSDEITKGLVYQFHLDVTGVRYLKLVTKAVGDISSMNSAWGGTCVYNNSGYYPKTDMFGDFNGDNAAYEEPADPTMFNTYQFENLPDDAVSLLSRSLVGTYTPGIGKDACWIGGTHVAVNGLENDSMKDGIKLPAGSSPYFKNNKASDSNSAAEGYVIYDVSDANADTFYAMIGVTDQDPKYLDYDPETGDYGGVVFDVWGKYEGSDDFELLCSSEVITKSNSGEFIVDITGVQQLKIRHYQKDPRATVQMHGCFGYASVYKETWTVTASGEDAVLQGMKADYTADVTRKLIPGDYYHYTGDIAWDVDDEQLPGTTMEDGKLTVDSYETASSVKVTASIQEGGKTIIATKAVGITPTGDNVAYVEQTGYETLADAVADAAGKTVVMVKDVTQDAPVDLNADVEWNLNGKTVSGETLMNLGENANLNIVGDGGSLDGKLKLTGSDAEITADTAIAVEINGCDGTVTGKNVTLTDSATDKGDTGGKIYGSFTADTVSQNGDIRYVILSGTDDNGETYKTANAVRVRMSRVSVRTNRAGIYYTTTLMFNKNVVNAGATYGVVLSTDGPISENFMRAMNAEGSLVNRWTVGKPDQDTNFISTGKNSCLLSGILDANESASVNDKCGAVDVYANGYVQLTLGGETVTIMAENGNVKYSMKTIMEIFDTKLAEELNGTAELSDTAKIVFGFYKNWMNNGMGSWALPNLKAYAAKSA